MLSLDDIWKNIKPRILGMTVKGTFTPAWTALTANPAIGNGSNEGWYTLQGKMCKVQITIVMGSTTTFGTGAWRIGLPFPAMNRDGNQQWIGNAYILDSNTSQLHTEMILVESGYSYIRFMFADHDNLSAAQWASNTPIVWANGDGIAIDVEYEVE